jgi:hypothetical protein
MIKRVIKIQLSALLGIVANVRQSAAESDD